MALLVVGVAALGYNLRGAITSLPPLFPELQSSLDLSAAVVSVLAAAPVICFGVVSGFAAWFSRRLGEERVLLIAAVALVAGLLLRAAAPRALLFPGTILASAAIAVMNVLLSSLIKRPCRSARSSARWSPCRCGTPRAGRCRWQSAGSPPRRPSRWSSGYPSSGTEQAPRALPASQKGAPVSGPRSAACGTSAERRRGDTGSERPGGERG
jgi:hypothetical protein